MASTSRKILMEGILIIENQGNQPIVLLDVDLSLYRVGQRCLFKQDILLPNSVVARNQKLELDYNFKSELAERNIQPWDCAYLISILVADVSRTVVALYEFAPVVGQVTCQLGMPMRFRWFHFRRGLRWRYYRAKPLIDRIQRLREWENSEANRSSPEDK